MNLINFDNINLIFTNLYKLKDFPKISLISQNKQLNLFLRLSSVASIIFLCMKIYWHNKGKDFLAKPLSIEDDLNRDFNLQRDLINYQSITGDNLIDIFSNLKSKELNAVALVNKDWCEKANLLTIRRNAIYEDFAFNPEDWNHYFKEGVISEEEILRAKESLPRDIYHILNSPCKIFPDLKVGNTHILFYIPKNIEGKALTLDLFIKIAALTTENGINRVYLADLLDKTIDSGWFLMAKEALRGSVNKNLEEHDQLLQNLSSHSNKNYKCPTILEIMISLETYKRKFKTTICFKDRENSLIFGRTKEIMSPQNLAPYKTCLVFRLHSIFEESFNKDLFFKDYPNLKGKVIWWTNSDPLGDVDVGLFPILKL